MDFSQSPIFNKLSSDECNALLSLAQRRRVPAGETLFQEGDPAGALWLLAAGRCVLSRSAEPVGEARPGDVLDLVAVLCGLSHSLRAVTITDCDLLYWPVDMLWQSGEFAAEARRYLGSTLQAAQRRLEELEAPVHYQGDTAQLIPGPFVFKNTTLALAFCDADLDHLRPTLTEGLSLFRPAWRGRDSVFLALAKFPSAHPDHHPDARFSYTETTCFVPVRWGGKFGLYPAWIYPSAWEPILLGREIYGFPKRLGRTEFGNNHISLRVDGTTHFSLSYEQTETVTEARLVRALSDWVGIEGRVIEAAFRLGDVLLDVMQSPLYRRVSVYNHKRIPAVNSSVDSPAYDVDQLTQAVFSVTRWHDVTRMCQPALTVSGGALAGANLTLREAYLTRLDMRLSTGRIVRDYNRNP